VGNWKLLFVFALALNGFSTRSSGAVPRLGHVAPDLNLSDKNGNPVSLRSFKGKVVVIDFWATWCGPCVRSLPHLQELHEQYAGQNVVVLGINIQGQTPSPEVLKFIQSKGLTFPMLFDCCDFDAPSMVAYGVQSIPRTFVLDGDQMVKFTDHPRELKAQVLDGFISSGIRLARKGSSLTEANAWIEKAIALNDNSDTEVAYYRKALSIDPKNTRAHHLLGVVYEKQKRVEAAIAEYLAASSLDPADAHLHKHLGEAYTLLNEPEQAIRQYREYLKKSRPGARDNAEVYHDLAKLLEARGELNDAADAFRESLETGPVDERRGTHADAHKADVHAHLGRIYAKQKLYPQAEQEFQSALKFNPQDVGALRELGSAFLRRGRAADAIPPLEKAKAAIRAGESGLEVWHLLGQAYEQVGRLSEARAEYERCLRERPDDSHYKQHVAGLQSARVPAPVQSRVRLPDEVASLPPVLRIRVNDMAEMDARVMERDLVFLGDPPAWRQGLNKIMMNVLGTRQILFLLRTAGHQQIMKPFERSFALVIAVGNYSEAVNGKSMVELKGALSSAKTVASMLTAQGFTVKELPNARRTEIEDAMRAIARQTSPADRLLVYFVGHGVTHEVVKGIPRGYLVPADGHRDDPLSLIPMTDFGEKYAISIPAKHILFVLDSCYSGLALSFYDGNSSPASAAEILVRSRERGRAILAAGEANQRSAFDPELGSTFFTHYFIRAIRDREADMDPRDGIITQDELRSYMTRRVIDAAAKKLHEQKPHLDKIAPAMGSGEFIFVVN
jgi:tetratricopeptide (TPR) repeat protein/peroxiredoxin